MGCGNSRTQPIPPISTAKTVVVLGATGELGQAVVRALVTNGMFTVKAVTRHPNSEVADCLRNTGASVEYGNFDDITGLMRIMDGTYGCFFTSSYWTSLSNEKEIRQGKDVIYVARQCGVRHFVFSGHTMASRFIGKHCRPLDGKATIEEHLRSHPLPASSPIGMRYTVIHVSFLFDSLLSILKPHPLKDGKYAIALPMEGRPLDGISSDDVGRCVREIFCNYHRFGNRVLNLSADSNTVDDLVNILDRHLWPKQFVNPKIRITDFEKLDFREAGDLASVFLFYQKYCGIKDEVIATHKMFPYVRSFEEWVIDEQRRLEEITTYNIKRRPLSSK